MTWTNGVKLQIATMWFNKNILAGLSGRSGPHYDRSEGAHERPTDGVAAIGPSILTRSVQTERGRQVDLFPTRAYILFRLFV